MDSAQTSALLHLLTTSGGLPNFFDLIFNFLRTRTDFYVELTGKNTSAGFRPGHSEAMVRQSYMKHLSIFQEAQHKRDSGDRSAVEQSRVKQDEPVIPPAAPDAAPPIESDSVDVARKVYTADSDCYNGATFESYAWSQSIGDIDVSVKVPPLVVRSKELDVNIGKQHITIKMLHNEECITLLDGDLSWPIRATEVTWSFIPADHRLVVNMEKVEERWWDRFLDCEAKLNTREIDCSRPYEDLDDEAQGKINQMMHDQHMKRLGKPTSEQEKLNSVLEKAWNVEGSPFAGQPFDPSRVTGAPNHPET